MPYSKHAGRKSSTRHFRPNKDFDYSSLVLDSKAHQRLIDQGRVLDKLDYGLELTPKEKRQATAHISRMISYDTFEYDNRLTNNKIIGRHWNAVMQYTYTGKTDLMEDLIRDHGDEKGRLPVFYGKGARRRIFLETDLQKLSDYAYAGLFQSGQELALDEVLSYNL